MKRRRMEARRKRRLIFEFMEPRRLLAVDLGYWSSVEKNSLPPREPSFPFANHSLFSLNRSALQNSLNAAPLEQSASVSESPCILVLPTPEGSTARFRVVNSPIMEPGLAEKFPSIQTYLGQGMDDAAATLRFDLSPLGFRAQVLGPQGRFYIDPYQNSEDAIYVSYRAASTDTRPEFHEFAIPPSDSVDSKRENLPTTTKGIDSQSKDSGVLPAANTANRSGTQLRTYRAAVAATGEYTSFHGGTVAAGQAAIVSAINRINGIYETELSIRLVLVANNDLLVYTNAATDPYTNNDGVAMLTQNQNNITAVIGNANYDIGHVFSTGGGGIAGLGVVGITGQKARGVTGSPSPTGDAFWVDYVAHEMGHQFGGNHTFNSSSGSCSGNRNASTAYEPGSGSTIQAYAGICGSDDLQSNSDAYFHSISFDEIVNYVDTTIPSVGTRTATGNTVPTVNGGADYTIPAQTPFELTAVGTDANGDVLTYNWEQRNLGASQTLSALDNGSSPLFRSWTPTTNPTRTFPRLSNLLNNTVPLGERLPTTTRTLNFRATVRDNRAGGGGVNTDDVIINVVNTGSAFAVTSPNTAVSWPGLSSQTVTWNVSGTTASPINSASVDVRLSVDGGNTFPILLASATANDGSEAVNIPNNPTTQARIRVQGTGNVFFDLSNVNFTITAASNALEFGDAPNTYGTLEASNGARHATGGPTLGSLIDFEADGQPSTAADGDGIDEDGVNFINPLVRGTTTTMEVRSSSGGGVLDYFFDFDGNGVFGNQPNEIFNTTLTGGTQLVNVTVPSNAVTTPTYARFRISQAGGLGPTGLAPGGEVEDYAVTIFASAPSFDFGDAPDPAYATLLANNGPRHSLGSSRLGAAIDAESNGQPNSTATGDGGDDDGILFLTPIVPNSNATIQVTSTGGVLNYFVDFDANGVFGNVANEVFSATLTSGTQNVTFATPASAVLGTTRARFRLSTAGGLGPTGLASDGEVEDYQVLVVEPPTVSTLFENFDGVTPPALPVNWSATTTASNSWQTSATSSNTAPNSVFVPSISSVSDASLVSPSFSVTSSNKQFQFSHNFDLEFLSATVGYDGGVLEISINGGAYQDILAAGGSFLQNGYNSTISSNYASPIGGRAAWSGNSTNIAGNQGGYITTIVDLPASAVGQSARLRWRSVTDSSIQNVGWRVDSIQRIGRQFTFDYGDAPDPTYPTLSASNGASHVAGALRLGSAIDGEVDGLASANASGDGADDDGVVFPIPLVGGASNSFVVQVSAPALLSAWLDINGNGSWNEANEQIIKDQPVVSGANTINVVLPNVTNQTNTFARFRLSTQAGLGTIGSVGDGEVEDYAVSIRPSDTTPPSVVQVKATSTSWSNEFKSYLDSAIATSNDSRGYAIPTSTSEAQLRPLSWVNVDSLVLQFSEDVQGSGAGGAFVVPNATQTGDVQIFGVNTANYGNAAAVQSLVYDSASKSLIIRFASNLNADKLLVTSNNRIKDLAGNNLPSFSFRLNVLPGDANGSAVVANNDATFVRFQLDRATQDGANFDPFRDVNGTGIIANNDATLVRIRLDTALPSGEPSAGSGSRLWSVYSPPGSGIFDIRGLGNLVVGEGDAKFLSNQQGRLRIISDASNQIVFTNNWNVGIPYQENDQWIHQGTIGETKMEVIDQSIASNPFLPFDVDRSGEVGPLDVLALLNFINRTSVSTNVAELTSLGAQIEMYYDVSKDNIIDPLDLLSLINHINQDVSTFAEGEGILDSMGMDAMFDDIYWRKKLARS